MPSAKIAKMNQLRRTKWQREITSTKVAHTGVLDQNNKNFLYEFERFPMGIMIFVMSGNQSF